jgi:hypothetical protein
MKYDIYIPSNYNHRSDGTSNNKGFMHLWAGIASGYRGDTRTAPILGPNFHPNGNGTSNIRMWAGARVNGSTVTLDYHWGYGDGIIETDHTWAELGLQGYNANAITQNDFGKWMTITIHAKKASIANNDGIYELWKKDWEGAQTKLIDIPDGPWWHTKPDGTDGTGFQYGYLLGWANSGWNEDTTLYIDNIEFSETSLL